MTAPDLFAIDYHELFRSLPGSYLLLAPDGTILDNSDEHVQVSMLPREEAVGRNIFAAYPSAPESQQALHESHEYVRRHLKPHTMPITRYDLLRPAEQGGDFEVRYWQITHYPILDREGKLRFILQRPEDVTERHLTGLRQEAMEQQLAQVKEEAEFILENLPVMVATTPPEGTTNYFNREWRTFTGRSQEELANGRVLELIHPEDRPHILTWREEQFRSHDVSEVEFRVRRYDGDYRWVMTRSVTYFGTDGRARLRVSSSTDVHEQKIMVQEMLEASQRQDLLVDQAQQAQHLAEEQRATFYGLFMQAPAMIAIVRGPEHRFEFVNPSYQQLFPHRDLIGLPVAEAVPEVVEQGFIGILDNVFRTGETFYGNELPVQLDRDGSGQLRESYFNFIYQQLREHDAPAGIMCFAFEVTELVHARQKFEALYQDAIGGSGALPTVS